MKRLITGGLTAIGLTIVLSSGVSAHVIVVDNGKSEPKVGWVGAADIPGQGKGLVPGGPDGSFTLTPAHEKGLVKACEALKANGNGIVQIFGPPTPAGCPHGT